MKHVINVDYLVVKIKYNRLTLILIGMSII